MSYVIAAAGTGGHVNPALSVAEALVDRGVPRHDVLFIGGDRFEAEAVPRAGFPYLGFELTHLRRSASPENLRIPALLRRTAGAMANEIRQAGANVVLGMSGYVTVPAAMAARRAGVPFVLQEQNAVPGLAARFASRRATRTFLGLPGRAERLPRSTVVGNPLRPALHDFDRRSLRTQGRRRYGVEGATPVLGVLGGSQGARVLNESVARIVETGVPGSVVHVTGRAALGDMKRLADEASLPWTCVPYEPEIEYFYAAVDLLVCRAGAMTVSELAATATPSVLVPLARVGQQGNAAVLGDAEAAEIVPEGDIGSLPRLIRDLLPDERRLAAMTRDARSVHRADAAGVIADYLIEVSDG